MWNMKTIKKTKKAEETCFYSSKFQNTQKYSDLTMWVPRGGWEHSWDNQNLVEAALSIWENADKTLKLWIKTREHPTCLFFFGL